jgi:purine nucleoside phosphorylase
MNIKIASDNHSMNDLTAIIGGSALSQLPGLHIKERRVVRTPFGEPSGVLIFGQIGEAAVVFLARNGYGRTILPHLINYRANIWAMRSVDVDRIIAVSSVNSLDSVSGTGTLVIPDQVIDYTTGRDNTFYDNSEHEIIPLDFTNPFDETIRHALLEAAQIHGVAVAANGTYACTQGPRLQTAAEMQRSLRDGAHIVGQTVMPEAVLARELEIPYAMLALITNRSQRTGITPQQSSLRPSTHTGSPKALTDLQGVLAHTVRHMTVIHS